MLRFISSFSPQFLTYPKTAASYRVLPSPQLPTLVRSFGRASRGLASTRGSKRLPCTTERFSTFLPLRSPSSSTSLAHLSPVPLSTILLSKRVKLPASFLSPGSLSRSAASISSLSSTFLEDPLTVATTDSTATTSQPPLLGDTIPCDIRQSTNAVHSPGRFDTEARVENESFMDDSCAASFVHGSPLLKPYSLSPHEAIPEVTPNLKDIFGSVVKIYTDFTDPNYAQPWQMRRQLKSTG
ncbi:serine protease [Cardiosporidium cionae]|uniref:Serine protease n=1 Tax=Cardiosporidium cionae TaxID=476202 RepID=A0ABQ7JDZ9_9APIC|nr:serine protease [Cardiosporidium cionae]|eukprot:KAF8822247.1 serine protease [Cardiosporidium cionae]